MTPLGVVFLFMLLNWWVEKHQRFLFNVCKRFFNFCHVFTFLTFFIFLERFLHLYGSFTKQNLVAYWRAHVGGHKNWGVGALPVGIGGVSDP